MISLDDFAKNLKAFSENPNDFRTTKQLAIAYRKNNEYEKSIELYNRAIKLRPNSFDIYTDLGLIYYKQKKYDLAFTMLKKSLEIKNDDIFTLHNYIKCHNKIYSDDDEFLKRCLETLLSKNEITKEELNLLYGIYKKDNNNVGLDLIKDLLNQHDILAYEDMSFEQAKEYIFSIITKENKRIKAYCLLLEKHGYRKEIYDFLNNEIDKNKSKLENYIIYADYLLKDNKVNEAIEKLYEFMIVNPSKQKTLVYQALLKLYIKIGNIEKANKMINKLEKIIIEKEEKNIVKEYEYKIMSRAFALIGNNDKAKEYWEKSRELIIKKTK